MINSRKNITVSTPETTFQFSDLVISVNGEQTDTLELSRKDRIYLFKLRQTWIIQNCKSIERAKRNSSEKTHKIIEDLCTVNRTLEKEIEILRHTTEFLRESPLLDTFEYQAYFAKQALNSIPSKKEDFNLVEEFSKFISTQPTDKAVEIIKPMMKNHGYSLRRLAFKD